MANREDGPDLWAVITEQLKHYATKADLERSKNSLLKWIFGIVLSAIAAISGIVAIIVRFVE